MCSFLIQFYDRCKQGSQLVPELLLKLPDTLLIQYRCIEHVHEEVTCKKSTF